MIRAICEQIEQLIAGGDDLVFLTADIGGDGVDALAKIIGARFIDVGIAEATMIGVAAGFGLSGTSPIIYGLASFVTRRAFEHIKVDLVANDVSGVILGGASGATLGALGITHVADDDVALMRSLGDIAIFSPRNASQASDALRFALSTHKLCYIRLSPDRGSGQNKIAFGDGSPDIIGSGENVAILTSGPCVQAALGARATFQARGKASPAVIHLRTIHPLHQQDILPLLSQYTSIITVEDHRRDGGMGTNIAEILADCRSSKGLIRIGILPDAGRISWTDGHSMSASLETLIIESTLNEMEKTS